MKRALKIGLGIVVLICISFYIYLSLNNNNSFFYNGYTQVLGGIISGTLTVYGVSLTIKYQEKAKKDDLKQTQERQKEQFRLENLPILQWTLNLFENRDDIEYYTVKCNSNLINNSETSSKIIYLQLKNIGFNAAQNIRINVLKHSDVQLTNVYDYKKSLFLKPSESLNVKIEYIIYNSITDLNYPDDLKIIIFYEDLIGNKYVKENSYSSNGNNPSVSLESNNSYIHIKDQFIYTIPQENFNSNEQLNRVVDFYKNQSKIVEIVNEYSSNNEKYEKLRMSHFFVKGDGYFSSYKTIERNRLYEVTQVINESTHDMKYLKYKRIYQVNIIEKVVIKYEIKLIESNLPKNKIKEFMC